MRLGSLSEKPRNEGAATTSPALAPCAFSRSPLQTSTPRRFHTGREGMECGRDLGGLWYSFSPVLIAGSAERPNQKGVLSSARVQAPCPGSRPPLRRCDVTGLHRTHQGKCNAGSVRWCLPASALKKSRHASLGSEAVHSVLRPAPRHPHQSLPQASNRRVSLSSRDP